MSRFKLSPILSFMNISTVITYFYFQTPGSDMERLTGLVQSLVQAVGLLTTSSLEEKVSSLKLKGVAVQAADGASEPVADHFICTRPLQDERELAEFCLRLENSTFLHSLVCGIHMVCTIWLTIWRRMRFSLSLSNENACQKMNFQRQWLSWTENCNISILRAH